MSDIQLDRPMVVEKLQRVFEGFETAGTDPLFILMGNFVNKPYTAPGGREAIADAFSALGDAIASCPRIAKNAKFLLVPGPQDVGTHHALPRRPIPEIFTKELRKKVTHVTFASNPCRLRFFTQEIVLFREGNSLVFTLLFINHLNLITPLLLRMTRFTAKNATSYSSTATHG